jgi:hypothetical protein
LCIPNALPSSGTHLSPFTFLDLRRSNWFRRAPEEHGPEFSNLSVDTELLLFKAFDGGDEDLGSEFVCRHVNSTISLTLCVPTIVYRYPPNSSSSSRSSTSARAATCAEVSGSASLEIALSFKDWHMAVYFARWKDGSFSIVEADDEDDACELLDEFGDEPAELWPLKSCLIDFQLTDRGSFRLGHFGELMQDEILEWGYPPSASRIRECGIARIRPRTGWGSGT